MRIERDAVRPDAAQPGAVAGEERFREVAHAFRGRPLIDRVAAQIGIQQPRIRAAPDGPFEEHEAVGDFLDRRARGHERIEARVVADDDAGAGRRFGLRYGR